MSDLSTLHAKIDFLVGHVATLATQVTTLATQVTTLATQVATLATRDELTEMRAAIMARIDRLQDASTIQHHERIVDVAASERAERLAKAARDDATSLGEIVTPLIRVVHGMRTQLDDLAEQVRVLKEGRAA
jgi:methyl-accepting chemotaxis protein